MSVSVGPTVNFYFAASTEFCLKYHLNSNLIFIKNEAEKFSIFHLTYIHLNRYSE